LIPYVWEGHGGPAGKQEKRPVWQLIGLYLGKASFGSAYGAAGSLVVMLVWVYYPPSPNKLSTQRASFFVVGKSTYAVLPCRNSVKNRIQADDSR
jgi:membrane protein